MSGPGRRRGVAGLALAVLLLGAVAFWDAGIWIRPLLQHYVREHADRRIDFDTAHLGLDGGQPQIVLRGLTVENARWATVGAPLIHAGEFGLTLDWSSLWGGPTVISRMVLVDADIDLERSADGLRNWRLSRPDDRGPGRLRVQRLQALRSRLRVVHSGLGLTLNVVSAPSSGHPTLPQTLTLHGTRQGVEFDARAAVPSVITLYDSGVWFDLEGQASVGQAHLALHGRAHDLMQLGGFEGDVQADGQHLRQAAALFGIEAPAPRGDLALSASAHVDHDGDHWGVSHLSARFGDSDLKGSFDYRARRPDGGRPQWRGTAVSDVIDLTQLLPPKPAIAGAQPAARSAWPRPSLDIDLDWRVATLRGAPVPIGAVHAVLSARDGPWRLGPVELTASGGRIAGTASLDTATEPASAAADLRVTGLPLDRFGRGQLAGRLDARASLRARGDRLDALLGAVSGEVSATLSGASLPAALEAKLGLDGGRWLEALLSSPARSPITCSGLQVRFAEGKGEIRYLALETADLVVRGSGALDLPRRAVDLTLTPRRKHATWLALDRAVHVAGAVGHVVVSLVDPPQSGDAAQCASVTP